MEQGPLRVPARVAGEYWVGKWHEKPSALLLSGALLLFGRAMPLMSLALRTQCKNFFSIHSYMRKFQSRRKIRNIFRRNASCRHADHPPSLKAEWFGAHSVR